MCHAMGKTTRFLGVCLLLPDWKADLYNDLCREVHHNEYPERDLYVPAVRCASATSGEEEPAWHDCCARCLHAYGL